jgi:hypothetical protein
VRPLDFLVIGAQKAGTTTLFQLLSEHPQVFVPPGKELPFFNRGGASAEGYAAFMDEHFSGQPNDVRIGKVTPHYLSDPTVPARLKALTHRTRLVAILRDPVERAFSHYRMSVRRGIELRSFSEAVNDMLAPGDLAEARTLATGRTSENRTYVAWSEYGRLFAPYADEIKRGDFLVLSTKDLEVDPAATMRRLLNFLGLEMVELPSLGKKMHQGGSRERLPIEAIARSLAPVRWFWRRIPHRYRSRVLFRVGQWNVVASPQDADVLSADTADRLRAHFAPDAVALETLTGWHPDWLA